ncbi:hypothetical protein [Trichlorobacter ammonificans]|uniref:pEK499-p136 HEPN domain-containing protein n=1 Tax=Trichlorobacter ammonificans TaxID=2916410 RepID=A0ABM9DAC8_9BACT|nr:hypothetical protein [Trichlorobacter ammonificans]CAH2032195.1 conserved protein of unknown function [Trichlorobacter ammonificans]
MQYENYIKDFPARCSTLLDKFEDQARLLELDVTFLFSIASVGLTIPIERLKKPYINEKEPDKNSTPHPANDRDNYPNARDAMQNLRHKNFKRSELWDTTMQPWYYGRLSSTLGPPDAWPELSELSKTSEVHSETTDCILNHIRNSLAHGNIYTSGNPIKKIIFLSELSTEKGKFNFLVIPLLGFSKFLRNWFAFINKLDISQSPVQGVIYDDGQRDMRIDLSHHGKAQ